MIALMIVLFVIAVTAEVSCHKSKIAQTLAGVCGIVFWLWILFG